MNKAVLQFVSPQQNGFVPGGFLPENIMLLKLIQAHVEDEDEDAYFVFSTWKRRLTDRPGHT